MGPDQNSPSGNESQRSDASDSCGAGKDTDSAKPIRFSLRTLLTVVAVAGVLMAVPLVGRALFITAAMLVGIMILQLPVYLILRRMSSRGDE